MPDYQGQNYKVNRKVKEAVDKNQINYRESSSTPISIIKRVYIYITDKKGHILPEVTLTIDGVEVKTSYNGLLISNFPNEEKTIIAEKEGYKSATATVILNAEVQTHEFFLALENDDDESEVISTDNTKPNEDFNKCGTLFELSDNNTLISWSTLTNEIVDGVYTGNGSRLAQGWSNKGLWQIDYDIKYNSSASSHIGYYVGVIIFGSKDINPWPHNGEKYAMSIWEKWAAPDGLDAIKLEGPSNYKYSNANEYHHVTVRKTAKNRIEYYFDDKKWVYSVPKLNEFDTFYFGYRDNPSFRNSGITISTKNLKVIGLCPQGETITLNDTVELGDLYQFISYNDSEGNEEWGPGIVEIESIPEDDELYIGVKVIENKANDSFIGQTFYVKKDSQVGNNIYPLYSDELGTETGIYVKIGEKIILNDTVNLDDRYQFISYNDSEGNEEWGPGIVEIESIPENNELYIGVKVIENEANDSFIGQTFYIRKDTQVGNNIYPLYSDEFGTETGLYVKIGDKIKRIRFVDEEENPISEVKLCIEDSISYEILMTLLSDENGYISLTENQINFTDNQTYYFIKEGYMLNEAGIMFNGTTLSTCFAEEHVFVLETIEEEVYDITISTDKETLSSSNNEFAQLSITPSNNIIINNDDYVFIYNSELIEIDNEGYVYVPFECGDTNWMYQSSTVSNFPTILNEQKEVIAESIQANPPQYTSWANNELIRNNYMQDPVDINNIETGFKGFFKLPIIEAASYSQNLGSVIYLSSGLSYNYSKANRLGEEELKVVVINITNDQITVKPYTSNTCTITEIE